MAIRYNSGHPKEQEVIAAHIAGGFAQAERGKLIDMEEAVRILRERGAKRNAKRLAEEHGTQERTRHLMQLPSHKPLKP
jgi:hypothetical protein